MTERLASLMREEVAGLTIPTPDPASVLTLGRSSRARRRTTLASGAAVVAVVGALVASQVIGGEGSGRAVDPPPAASSTLGDQPAFAVGRTLYLDSGARSVDLDEIVQTIFYTSAGILVRTNETGASDGGAPFHFALVGDDGAARPLDLTLPEVAPGVDPEQPYIAYTEMVDNLVQLVVVDVRTEDSVATVGIPEIINDRGFDAPPVSLDGDTAYVGGGKQTWAVDWRSGERTVAHALTGGFPQVSGGRTVLGSDERTQVVDVATGEVLLEGGRGTYASMSPDGSAAVITSFDTGRAHLHDLGTGVSSEVPDSGSGFGWTRDGRLFLVDGPSLQVCTPTDGCTSSPLDLPEPTGDAFVRLGGFVYQS